MRKHIALGLLGLMVLSLTSCGTHVGHYANADKYLAGNQTYTEEACFQKGLRLQYR